MKVILANYKMVLTEKGVVPEHRRVYEEYYLCSLLPWVQIHHINGDKRDNRIENLKPLNRSQHKKFHIIKPFRIHKGLFLK